MRRMLTEEEVIELINEHGGGGGGTGNIDPVELLSKLEGNEDIVVDLNEAGNAVEIHLDQEYKNGVATKTELANKQDKLSQVDLDNIAMINQYAQNISTNTSDISSLKTSKQNKLVAGDNITIDPDTNKISATGGGGGLTEAEVDARIDLKINGVLEEVL